MKFENTNEVVQMLRMHHEFNQQGAIDFVSAVIALGRRNGLAFQLGHEEGYDKAREDLAKYFDRASGGNTNSASETARTIRTADLSEES